MSGSKNQTSQVSESLPFNNESTGLFAENARDAILEVKDIATLPVYPVVLQHNGTVGDGTFFGYSALIPGNETPIVIVANSELSALTFSNKNSNADYTLFLRKNSTVATPFYTITKTNTQFFREILPSPEPFTAGDTIFVEYQDDGQNASDVGINLYFRVV